MDRNNEQPIENTIKSRVYGHGRGWCFTPKAFKGLGSGATIRKALSRLEAKGFIRRLTQGLYEYPRKHEKLGLLPPLAEDIAKAIAERDNIKIQPSGAYAANLLGLSEQVPSQVVFLTDGPSKKLKIGKTEITFKKTTVKNMSSAGTLLGLIIQALKYIGNDNLTPPQVKKLRKHIKTLDKKVLWPNLFDAPAWIHDVILLLHGSQDG